MLRFPTVDSSHDHRSIFQGGGSCQVAAALAVLHGGYQRDTRDGKRKKGDKEERLCRIDAATTVANAYLISNSLPSHIWGGADVSDALSPRGPFLLVALRRDSTAVVRQCRVKLNGRRDARCDLNQKKPCSEAGRCVVLVPDRRRAQGEQSEAAASCGSEEPN